MHEGEKITYVNRNLILKLFKEYSQISLKSGEV